MYDDLKEKISSLLNEGVAPSVIAIQLKVSGKFVREFAKLTSKERKQKNEKNILNELAKEIASQKSEKNIVLTEEQKEQILNAWNVDKVESLKDLTQLIFGGGYNGTSLQGKAIKQFLASRELKATVKPVPVSKAIELNDEQQEFIRNNIGALSPIEIAHSLFNNPNLHPLCAEARAVRKFIEKTLPPNSFKTKVSKKGDEIMKEYHPPQTDKEAVARINAFVFEKLDMDKLDSRQKRNLTKLKHYLNVHRFKTIMNEFVSERDQELMESSFVRFVYDKSDLSEEEVDLYINWCLDIVNHTQINRELNQLKIVRDQSLDDKGTINKPLVDQINKLWEALDANQKRQKSAQNDLSGKRKDRVDSTRDNFNLLQLVEAFKTKEKRDKIIMLAEARKQKLVDETNRIETMDELKSEIFGLSKDEIINGLF